jgi:hypothetical protein
MLSFMDDSMAPGARATVQDFLASKSLDAAHRTDLRRRIRGRIPDPAYGGAS